MNSYYEDEEAGFEDTPSLDIKNICNIFVGTLVCK